jgi:hypothetical protein
MLEHRGNSIGLRDLSDIAFHAELSGEKEVQKTSEPTVEETTQLTEAEDPKEEEVKPQAQ